MIIRLHIPLEVGQMIAEETEGSLTRGGQPITLVSGASCTATLEGCPHFVRMFKSTTAMIFLILEVVFLDETFRLRGACSTQDLQFAISCQQHI